MSIPSRCARPRRVPDAYAELLTPHPFRATTSPNDDGYDGYDGADCGAGDPFHSLCMQHMLPFHVIGQHRLSARGADHRADKLGRAMELFARDLQSQERLTVQIAGRLQAELEPKGVGVVLEAWP